MANKKELIAQYHAATSALCAASDRSNNKKFSDELSELMETKLSPVDRINGESISGIYSYGSFDPEKASAQRIQEKIRAAENLAGKYGVEIPAVKDR